MDGTEGAERTLMNRPAPEQASQTSASGGGLAGRLGGIGYLVSVALCVVSVSVGAMRGEPGVVLTGVVAGLAAWSLKPFVARIPGWSGMLAGHGEGDFSGEPAAAGPSGSWPVVREICALLIERERLERSRRGPDFDPWALQSVRVRLREALERDPSLKGFLNDR